MDLLTFIVMTLAVWRLTKIVNEEEGPFEIFKYIRASFPTDGKRGWIGRGIYCFWCVSFWFGLAIGLAYSPVPFGVIIGLALSALAILFDFIVELVGYKARNPK